MLFLKVASRHLPPLFTRVLAGKVPAKQSKNVRAHSSPHRSRKVGGGSSAREEAAAARFRRTLLQVARRSHSMLQLYLPTPLDQLIEIY
jgi:hypothetical protein